VHPSILLFVSDGFQKDILLGDFLQPAGLGKAVVENTGNFFFTICVSVVLTAIVSSGLKILLLMFHHTNLADPLDLIEEISAKLYAGEEVGHIRWIRCPLLTPRFVCVSQVMCKKYFFFTDIILVGPIPPKLKSDLEKSCITAHSLGFETPVDWSGDEGSKVADATVNLIDRIVSSKIANNQN
jgi:hypothetical protein